MAVERRVLQKSNLKVDQEDLNQAPAFSRAHWDTCSDPFLPSMTYVSAQQ